MTKPLRILVVDDDVDFRLLLTYQLAQVDRLDVIGNAADGFEALELVAELQPDGMVIDLMMPGMDGFELISELRQLERVPGMVAYSAMANEQAIEQVAQLGVELLTKSGNHTKLVEALLRSIEGDGPTPDRVPPTVV